MGNTTSHVVGAVAGTVAVGAIVGAIVAPIAVPALLALVGFGSAGLISGSIAAGIQSMIGDVAAGSIFAAAQRVAMGGATTAAITATGAAVGATIPPAVKAASSKKK